MISSFLSWFEVGWLRCSRILRYHGRKPITYGKGDIRHQCEIGADSLLASGDDDPVAYRQKIILAHKLDFKIARLDSILSYRSFGTKDCIVALRNDHSGACMFGFGDLVLLGSVRKHISSDSMGSETAL